MTGRIGVKSEFLLSHDNPVVTPNWWGEFAVCLRSGGLSLNGSYSRAESLGRIERGMVAGAVLDVGVTGAAALSFLRSIREIDDGLPCWLVARQAERRLLEAAFDLRVRSVLLEPVDVTALAASVLNGVYRMDRPN